MDVVVWLRSLGLGKYEAAFRENEIDETVLPNLTAEDLKDLGVSIVGHRRKILDAIPRPRLRSQTTMSMTAPPIHGCRASWSCPEGGVQLRRDQPRRTAARRLGGAARALQGGRLSRLSMGHHILV
jgi:hypothetical protein